MRNHYDILFDALEKLGEPEAAERAVRQALEIAQKLADEFPDMAQYRDLLAGGHFNPGNRLRKSGRLEQVEREYRASLAAYKRLCAQSPTSRSTARIWPPPTT